MRKFIDSLSSGWMQIAIWFVLLLPLMIGLGLVVKSMPLLQENSLIGILSSSTWSPMRGDFGFLPFIISTILVTVIATAISMPLCLLSAIHLTQYAPKWVLGFMHSVIDILAGIPSVVYGVWGILVIVPFVGDNLAPFFNAESSGYSILAGALVLAVMTIPYVLNMLIEVFNSIAVEYKEASLSLGATYWETIKFVVLKKGLSGILSAFGLGISKALGETIAVLMVVGNVVQFPKSVFDAGYPLPALIANNYGEMMSIPFYDSALMLAALLLFIIVIFFNVAARYLIQKTTITQ
jgi:phosphate transport system permease protein